MPLTHHLKPALLAMEVAFAITMPAHALTYSLASGNESWPTDKRNAIIACMNEAVATYNAHGYFDKHVTANYNTGVPTAQASYSGWIDFGGTIGTRVALHEIAHTLGVGQYWSWTDGGWWGPAANALVLIYDGQNAGIGTGGGHFWPYGMNYDNEDTSAVARERHCKLVAAMRWDMGIVVDSDSDGMPDDWETFQFGNLNQTGTGDADNDGVSNLAEYQTDSNPNVAGPASGSNYQIRSDFSGKLIDVWGASTADGGNIVQWADNSGSNQHWTVTHLGGGWYSFTNANSGKVLETSSMGLNDGDNVQQWSWLNNFGQQWRLTGGSNGDWRICNRQSGKAIDVNGFSSADGANIQQWTDWGGQLWEFLPLP
ncbi:RICIN domain-containing protein [Haloferula luteola]|nr:RICIN domain-containing protein [Haloferula luteola]